MGDEKRLSEADFAVAAAHLKLTGVEVMLRTVNGEFLLVMPNAGAAAGRWCFPGQIALRGSTLRETARRHLERDVGIRIAPDEAFRIKPFRWDERDWSEESGQNLEYVVHTFMVFVDTHEVPPLPRLAAKYNELRAFNEALIRGDSFHRFVARYVSEWKTENGVRQHPH